MDFDKHDPDFNESDRKLFRIKDLKTRADRLKSELVPKLRVLFRDTTSDLIECFGSECMADFRESFRPNHRKNADQTEDFQEARFGLVKKQIAGKYFYIWLCFETTEESVKTGLRMSRPEETGVLFSLLKKHREIVIPYLQQFELFVNHDSNEQDISNRLAVIDATQIDSSAQWQRGGIFSYSHAYPIETGAVLDELRDAFILLFPFFQATCNLLNGKPEDLEGLLERSRKHFPIDDDEDLPEEDPEVLDNDHPDPDLIGFERDDPDPDLAGFEGDDDAPDLVGFEGEGIEYNGRRYVRDKRLRAAKIRSVLKETGHLQCEVPGCGFDFFEFYGERGRGFAIVHHRNMVAKGGPTETKLSDLHIVCANCHAIIHRLDDDVSLDDLIPE